MFRRIAATLTTLFWLANLVSAVSAGPAQQMPAYSPLRFEHITIEDGLSQNAVLTILQDQRGYLWIGTQDGLNRYDGYGFEIFRHQGDNPNSLSHSSVLALAEDKEGILWIGTWGGGLNRFDPVTETFTAYRHDPADPTSLGHDTVTDLLLTREGIFWVGTSNGLERFNPKTGEFIHYRFDPLKHTSLSGNNISVLYQDPQGILWVGTGFGANGSGLNRYDPTTDSFIRYQHDPWNPTSISSDNISALYTDSAGRLWVGTGGYGLEGHGLNLLDPRAEAFKRFQHNPSDPYSLSNDNVMHIWQDQYGTLWVATWGGLNQGTAGDYRIIFTHITHDPYDLSSLSANTLWTIYPDRTGVIWIGTLNGGLNKFNPRRSQFELYRHNPSQPESLSFDVVSSFYEDKKGNFWIGTWGAGLEKFNRATRTFTHYAPDPNQPGSFPSPHVMSIYEDSQGILWIGTMHGLAQFNRATETFTTIKHTSRPDSLIFDSVNAIAEDAQQRLWISTMGGLDRYDRATGKFTHYLPDLNKPGAISESRVVTLYLDPQGTLWAGTWGGGLNRYDPATDSFTVYKNDPEDPTSLSENSVWSMVQDQKGHLWVGTQSGLNRMNKDGTFSRYGLKDGLPNEVIMGLVADYYGKLWISTGNGLVRYDSDKSTFRVFDVKDGLQSNEFNSGAYYIDRKGILYFGGVHGFNRFAPFTVRDSLVPPPVVITNFRVFNEPIQVDLSGRTRIEIPYWQDFIAFEFAALDYHASEKNRYAYKLEGFDSEWVEAGSRRYASYTNLPGGDYVFRVRATNSDGIWNETGVSIPLRVTPPFWQTWWFQGSLVLLVLGSIVGVYRWRVVNIKAQKEALEKVVTQRTEELRHQIDQRQRAEEALATKAAEEAVVTERNRLARDLHDAVTQTLFSASLIAEVLPDLWRVDETEARNSTEELRQLTRGALAEMRTLLLELRPASLTQARLGDLLKQLAEALIGRARLPINVTVEGERMLPPDVQVAFYRIAQESLNNVFKYARATQVDIALLLSSVGAHMEITDNGVGFDVSTIRPTSLGTRIMCERAESIAADFHVTSTPGKGTTVSVTWKEQNSQS